MSSLFHSKSISVRGSFDAEVFDETHANDVLNALYRNKKFCDVTIHTDDAQFPVHKCIVGSTSGFFDRMFSENGNNSKEIHVTNVTSPIMRVIIDYVYTSTLNVTDENVYSLYAAALHLQIRKIKRHCMKYLLTDLHPKQYIEVHDHATKLGLSELCDKIVSLISDKLSTDRDSLLQVASNDFTKILELRNKSFVSEEETYVAVVDWVKFDFTKRSKFFKDIFSNFDIHLFSRQFLKEVVLNEELVRTCNSCLNVVVDELAKEISSPKSHERKSSSKEIPPSFIVSTKEGTLHKFDISNAAWSDIYKKDFPRKETSLAFQEKHVYVIGGLGPDGLPSNAVSRIDVTSVGTGWQDMTSMHVKRRHCGAILFNGKIFVVGGIGVDGDDLSSSEVYDPTTGKWKRMENMNVPRSHPSLVTCSGRLYALAGNRNDEKLQSVDCYNPETGTWNLVAPIPLSKLYGPSAVEIGGAIYLIATIGLHASLEALKYDPATDSWSQLTSYNLPYLYTSSCAVGGKIYMIDKWRKGDEIAIYDPREDDWTTIIPQRKLGHRVRVSMAI